MRITANQASELRDLIDSAKDQLDMVQDELYQFDDEELTGEEREATSEEWAGTLDGPISEIEAVLKRFRSLYKSAVG